MRRLFYLLAILMLVMASCGDDEQFRVKGDVDGNATINIRVGYYARNAYQSLLTAARDGKFEFNGSAPEGAVVYLYDHDYRLLGMFYGINGTDYELSVVRGKPYAMKVKADGRGAEISNRFTNFLVAEADSLPAFPNGPVSRYVQGNPADIVSTLLLTSVYDAASEPLMADSLLRSIEPSARPSSITSGFSDMLSRVIVAYPPMDTIVYRTTAGTRDTFHYRKSAMTLFVADDRRNDRSTTIVPVLRALSRKYSKSRLQIMEVSLDNDTIEWKRSIAQDTAKWIQTWTPGSMSGPLADHLAIETIPYYMVVDFGGSVVYRGPGLRQAQDIITGKLK